VFVCQYKTMFYQNKLFIECAVVNDLVRIVTKIVLSLHEYGLIM
jgi:hypothetical protein